MFLKSKLCALRVIKAPILLRISARLAQHDPSRLLNGQQHCVENSGMRGPKFPQSESRAKFSLDARGNSN
jgi:hypothetical protein